MQKVRKIPQRQCVGCREMKDKKSLIRVVKSPEGAISLDFVGKKPGRGAYVCPAAACLAKARKSKALDRYEFIQQNQRLPRFRKQTHPD